MSNPYPPIREWRLPQAAVAATLASVVGAGRRGDEAGVFWLGERAAIASVTTVVSLRGRGVVESPGRWQVSSAVYGVVSRLARSRDLTLLATAHIHGRGIPVGMSLTDRRDGVRVPDFLAVVIGDGGDARDPQDWSFNVFDGHEFHELNGGSGERISFSDGDVSLFRADADGVREWSGREDQ
jgi:hypothetical protein